MQRAEPSETTQHVKPSYHYWHGNVPKSSIPINTAPQKIEAPIQIQQASKVGPSTWNTSGTWEERKISLKELDQKIASIIKGTKTLKQQAHVLSIQSSGQAGLIFARGKKSLTYDLKFTIQFMGLNSFEDTSATLKFQEFNDTGDREYSLACESGKNRHVVKQAVKDDIPRIIKFIEIELNKYKEL